MSPGGGPKDLKPPLLISTDPVELVNIKDNQEISIIFDEYINEGSIKKSLSIFPKNQNGIDFSYEGKIIRVEIPSDLDPNMIETTLLVSANEGSGEFGTTMKKRSRAKSKSRRMKKS